MIRRGHEFGRTCFYGSAIRGGRAGGFNAGLPVGGTEERCGGGAEESIEIFRPGVAEEQGVYRHGDTVEWDPGTGPAILTLPVEDVLG